MRTVVNVREAKTRLTELLHRVESGEDVVIARAGREVARLEPVDPRRRDFSAPLLPGLAVGDTSVFFAPDDDEVVAWEKEDSEDPLVIDRDVDPSHRTNAV